MAQEQASLAHTPTWVLAAVCLAIVSVSLVAERCLHRLGKVRSARCSLQTYFKASPPWLVN
jgi:hypothetical protein